MSLIIILNVKKKKNEWIMKEQKQETRILVGLSEIYIYTWQESVKKTFLFGHITPMAN